MSTSRAELRELPDLPQGWTYSVIVDTASVNRDKSLSCDLQIVVNATDGRSWITFRRMRLERQ